MVKEVKQSVNRLQVIGALEELNLVEETREGVELKHGEIKKKVTCQMIGKKEFKNPSMTLKVAKKDDNGNILKEDIIGVNFFNTYDKKLDENGNVVENPKFKAMQTIMNYEKGIRLKVTGSIATNEYATETEWKIGQPQVNAFNCTSSNVGEEDFADGRITGVIRTINEEVKDGEETGRLKVQFYTFDYNGKTSPIDLIVENDLTEDFMDLYENGCSCNLEIELVMKQNGGSTTKKHDFGRRKSKLVEGYSVMEVSVFGGDAPFEEESEYYIDMETMKQAMKEREIMIEQKLKEKKEKPKAEVQRKGLSDRKSTVDDAEDSPF